MEPRLAPPFRPTFKEPIANLFSMYRYLVSSLLPILSTPSYLPGAGGEGEGQEGGGQLGAVQASQLQKKEEEAQALKLLLHERGQQVRGHHSRLQNLCRYIHLGTYAAANTGCYRKIAPAH
jgi:hypothetical protein